MVVVVDVETVVVIGDGGGGSTGKWRDGRVGESSGGD